MNSLFILIVNALLYTCVFFWQAKKNALSIGITIWGLYTFTAWGTILFFLQPNFKGCIHDNPPHLDAVLYLFFVLLIFIFPLFSVKKMKKGNLVIPNEKSLIAFVLCLTVIQIVLFFADLSKITEILNMNSEQLLDTRTNVYYESNSLTAKIPILAFLSSIETGIHPLALGMSIFLLLCYKKYRTIIKVFFVVVVLTTIKMVVISVSRGEIVSNLVYIAILLVYLRDYISLKAKRIMILYLIPVILIFAIFFWTITISRFGDTASFMMYKYAGEPMINFVGLLYPEGQNTTNGHAYLLSWYFREFQSGIDKWEYIERIVKVPGNIFYTFVGGFVMEIGKIWTILLAVILNKIIKLTTKYQSLSSFIILMFFSYFYSYGAFLFKLQNQQGLFLVSFTIILYRYFEKRLHI